MAQQVVLGSWSMAQLSMRLRRVSKTKQWESFQRVMLAIVLIIWLVTVVTSAVSRLTSSDSGMRSASFGGESAAATGQSLMRSRKLASWVER